MPLREELREARRRQALTQSELAARSGVSRVTIARMEKGSAGDVRLGTASRLAAALGLEIVAVPLGGEPERDRRLARERDRVRRLERRLAHAALATRLLTARPPEARGLVATARATVDRWERERLCSHHYVSRWRAMLVGPIKRVAESLVKPGEWADALLQTTPWQSVLGRPRRRPRARRF